MKKRVKLQPKVASAVARKGARQHPMNKPIVTYRGGQRL